MEIVTSFEILVSRFFNEKQQLLIRDAVLYGSCGDEICDFSDGSFDSCAFLTKCIAGGGHFNGVETRKVLSEISKIIKTSEAGKYFSVHRVNWGTFRAIFIRTSSFEGGFKALIKWAMNFRLSFDNALFFYTRELEYVESLLYCKKNFASSSYEDVLKERISFLKEEIAKVK